MTNSPSPARIRRIATVGVPVADQDRALAFYRDALGFEVRMDATFGPDGRWLEVAPPGSEASIALVRADAANPAGVRTGIRLGTADAAADHASLVARGADVDREIMPFPVPMFLLRDPDGNTLIVVERPDV
jgi:predicted enzyme related to lactoylglutathione lyase